MITRCEACGQAIVGRVDSEGICMSCWRIGLVFAAAWIGDLRAGGHDEGEITHVIGGPPATAAALLEHHVSNLVAPTTVSYAGGAA